MFCSGFISSFIYFKLFLLVNQLLALSGFRYQGFLSMRCNISCVFHSVCCPWLKGHMNIGGDKAIKVCARAEAQMNTCTHRMRHTKHEWQKHKISLAHTGTSSTCTENERFYCQQGFSVKNRTLWISITFCCGTTTLTGNTIILRIYWKLCSIPTLYG